METGKLPSVDYDGGGGSYDGAAAAAAAAVSTASLQGYVLLTRSLSKAGKQGEGRV